MDDENELENQSIDIPIWKRYLLSVTEAAQFYHIGEKRLRQIVDIHPNGEFYLLVGNKVLFKKELFEQFLAESTAIYNCNLICKVVEKGAQMWYNNHARALFFERRQSYE